MPFMPPTGLGKTEISGFIRALLDAFPYSRGKKRGRSGPRQDRDAGRSSVVSKGPCTLNQVSLDMRTTNASRDVIDDSIPPSTTAFSLLSLIDI